ncbi:MAG: twin-arginine translocase TatA/TatE family subunit [Firmicutes bacterium]|nr:twin-arginine translocase TatA/TatE family subunit [Bacillota bacterium]
MRLGWMEILLIVVLALIVFGGTKLAGVGKSLGKGVREFKEELHADDEKSAESDEKEEK